MRCARGGGRKGCARDGVGMWIGGCVAGSRKAHM